MHYDAHTIVFLTLKQQTQQQTTDMHVHVHYSYSQKERLMTVYCIDVAVFRTVDSRDLFASVTELFWNNWHMSSLMQTCRVTFEPPCFKMCESEQCSSEKDDAYHSLTVFYIQP